MQEPHRQPVKEFVISEIKAISNFMNDDKDAVKLRQVIKDTDEEIKVLYPVASKPENASNQPLQLQLNKVSVRNREARENLKRLVRDIAPEFSESPRFATIYESFIDGRLNSETLEHVLTAFDRMATGKSTEAEAFNSGLEFITRKAKLPPDFFNRMQDA
ncbi:MAG: hypothetical protein ACYCQJ_16230 [Nitrososphaerales archaeon]